MSTSPSPVVLIGSYTRVRKNLQEVLQNIPQPIANDIIDKFASFAKKQYKGGDFRVTFIKAEKPPQKPTNTIWQGHQYPLSNNQHLFCMFQVFLGDGRAVKTKQSFFFNHSHIAAIATVPLDLTEEKWQKFEAFGQNLTEQSPFPTEEIRNQPTLDIPPAPSPEQKEPELPEESLEQSESGLEEVDAQEKPIETPEPNAPILPEETEQETPEQQAEPEEKENLSIKNGTEAEQEESPEQTQEKTEQVESKATESKKDASEELEDTSGEDSTDGEKAAKEQDEPEQKAEKKTEEPEVFTENKKKSEKEEKETKEQTPKPPETTEPEKDTEESPEAILQHKIKAEKATPPTEKEPEQQQSTTTKTPEEKTSPSKAVTPQTTPSIEPEIEQAPEPEIAIGAPHTPAKPKQQKQPEKSPKPEPTKEPQKNTPPPVTTPPKKEREENSKETTPEEEPQQDPQKDRTQKESDDVIEKDKNVPEPPKNWSAFDRFLATTGTLTTKKTLKEFFNANRSELALIGLNNWSTLNRFLEKNPQAVKALNSRGMITGRAQDIHRDIETERETPETKKQKQKIQKKEKDTDQRMDDVIRIIERNVRTYEDWYRRHELHEIIDDVPPRIGVTRREFAAALDHPSLSRNTRSAIKFFDRSAAQRHEESKQKDTLENSWLQQTTTSDDGRLVPLEQFLNNAIIQHSDWYASKTPSEIMAWLVPAIANRGFTAADLRTVMARNPAIAAAITSQPDPTLQNLNNLSVHLATNIAQHYDWYLRHTPEQLMAELPALLNISPEQLAEALKDLPEDQKKIFYAYDKDLARQHDENKKRGTPELSSNS